MATKYLGPEFDIHGGGLDLIFPHHENEQRPVATRPATASRGTGCTTPGSPWAARRCRSRWATRCPSTRCCSGARPIELRYYLVGPHYRSTIEYSEEALRRGRGRVPADRGVPARASGERVGDVRARRRCRPRLRRGDGRRPGHARRRWPSCTTRSARATPRSTRATRRPRPSGAARCGRCSACSASTRSTARWAAGRRRRRPRRRRSTRWSAPARAAAGGPGAHGLRRRRRDPRPARRRRVSRSRTPRTVPRWSLKDAVGHMAGNSQRRGAMRKPARRRARSSAPAASAGER